MITAILLATILYYLVPGTAAHTEIRYITNACAVNKYLPESAQTTIKNLTN